MKTFQEFCLEAYIVSVDESILDGFDDAHKKLMQQDLERHQRYLDRIKQMRQMASSVVGDSPQKPSKSSSKKTKSPQERIKKIKGIIDRELSHDDPK